jgi:hypothetical protein
MSCHERNMFYGTACRIFYREHNPENRDREGDWICVYAQFLSVSPQQSRSFCSSSSGRGACTGSMPRSSAMPRVLSCRCYHLQVHLLAGPNAHAPVHLLGRGALLLDYVPAHPRLAALHPDTIRPVSDLALRLPVVLAFPINSFFTFLVFHALDFWVVNLGKPPCYSRRRFLP